MVNPLTAFYSRMTIDSQVRLASANGIIAQSDLPSALAKLTLERTDSASVIDYNPKYWRELADWALVPLINA